MTGPTASTPQLLAVLRECHDALTTTVDEEVPSAERTEQLAEAEIKLRGRNSHIRQAEEMDAGMIHVTAGRIVQAVKRFWNRIFPLHTHCTGCAEKLSEPSRVGVCQTCEMW
jgi:hypothetical protein